LRSSRSIFFSLAVALLISSVAHPVSAGSGTSNLAAGAASMQVSVRVAQDPISTPLGSLAIVATVTSDGQPVPNATVAFNDAHNSAFGDHGSTASTNSSGVAVAAITLVSPFPGNDTITAGATASGYGSAKGTVVVFVLPFGIQQLAVTASVVNSGASGGSSEVIQGYVGTVDSTSSNGVANVGDFWSPAITGVSGVNVTLSDNIGSTFSSRTLTTDEFGFFSENFTLGRPAASAVDVLTLSASRDTYNGSESSIALLVNPYSPKSLTVTLDSFYPSTYSTILDSATLQARVSAGGAPVAGAPVTFSDSLGSLFVGPRATTDASGTASATVFFDSQSTGLDLFTAQASENGSSPGAGSNTLSVRPNGNTQLSVSEIVASANPVAGTAERVTGEVGWVGTSTMYAWSPNQNPVSGATVVISDSLGSFAPLTVLTNDAGIYSATFTVPSTGGKPDVIEAAASDLGYGGSTSSMLIVVSSQGAVGASAPNATTSASTTSATHPVTGPAAGLSSTSSTSRFETSSSSTSASTSLLSWSNPAVIPLVVVGFVAAALVVSRVAWVRKKRTR